MRAPIGCLDSPPILQSLLDALALRGPFEELGRKIQNHPTLSCLGTLSATCPCPCTQFKLQSQIMHVLQPASSILDISASLSVKLRVTLGDELFDSISFALADVSWLPNLKEALDSIKINILVCWLKTICGAWTTSHRLHEDDRLPCLFGSSEQDTITHYRLRNSDG